LERTVLPAGNRGDEQKKNGSRKGETRNEAGKRVTRTVESQKKANATRVIPRRRKE